MVKLPMRMKTSMTRARSLLFRRELTDGLGLWLGEELAGHAPLDHEQ
jgi:hypothetical protein